MSDSAGNFGHLVIIQRSGKDGRWFPLSKISTFGRNTACDLRIQLLNISFEHAKLMIQENGEAILENTGDHETKVNGEAIKGPVSLQENDVITMGERSFRFHPSKQAVKPLSEQPSNIEKTPTKKGEKTPSKSSHKKHKSSSKSSRKQQDPSSAQDQPSSPTLEFQQQSAARSATKIPQGEAGKENLYEPKEIPESSQSTDSATPSKSASKAPIGIQSASKSDQHPALPSSASQEVVFTPKKIYFDVYEGEESDPVKADGAVFSGNHVNALSASLIKSIQKQHTPSAKASTPATITTTPSSSKVAAASATPQPLAPTPEATRQPNEADSDEEEEHETPMSTPKHAITAPNTPADALLSTSKFVVRSIPTAIPALADDESAGEDSEVEQDVPAATKKVTFGPDLRPQVFDKELPPATPVRKGQKPFVVTPAVVPAANEFISPMSSSVVISSLPAEGHEESDEDQGDRETTPEPRPSVADRRPTPLRRFTPAEKAQHRRRLATPLKNEIAGHVFLRPAPVDKPANRRRTAELITLEEYNKTCTPQKPNAEETAAEDAGAESEEDAQEDITVPQLTMQDVKMKTPVKSTPVKTNETSSKNPRLATPLRNSIHAGIALNKHRQAEQLAAVQEEPTMMAVDESPELESQDLTSLPSAPPPTPCAPRDMNQAQEEAPSSPSTPSVAAHEKREALRKLATPLREEIKHHNIALKPVPAAAQVTTDVEEAVAQMEDNSPVEQPAAVTVEEQAPVALEIFSAEADVTVSSEIEDTPRKLADLRELAGMMQTPPQAAERFSVSIVPAGAIKLPSREAKSQPRLHPIGNKIRLPFENAPAVGAIKVALPSHSEEQISKTPAKGPSQLDVADADAEKFAQECLIVSITPEKKDSDPEVEAEVCEPAEKIEEQVEEQIEEKIEEKIDEQVEEQIEEKIEEQIKEQIKEKIEEQIKEQIKEKPNTIVSDAQDPVAPLQEEASTPEIAAEEASETAEIAEEEQPAQKTRGRKRKAAEPIEHPVAKRSTRRAGKNEQAEVIETAAESETVIVPAPQPEQEQPAAPRGRGRKPKEPTPAPVVEDVIAVTPEAEEQQPQPKVPARRGRKPKEPTPEPVVVSTTPAPEPEARPTKRAARSTRSKKPTPQPKIPSTTQLEAIPEVAEAEQEEAEEEEQPKPKTRSLREKKVQKLEEEPQLSATRKRAAPEEIEKPQPAKVARTTRGRKPAEVETEEPAAEEDVKPKASATTRSARGAAKKAEEVEVPAKSTRSTRSSSRS